MRVNEYDLQMENDLPALTKVAAFNYLGDCRLKSPETVAMLFREKYCLDKKAEEYVYLIGADSKMRKVSVFMISKGTVASSLCSAREVCIRLLLSGAVNVLMVHNHPSGDVEPSECDASITKSIQVACKLIGVNMCDSIIVGSDGYHSFKECDQLQEVSISKLNDVITKKKGDKNGFGIYF